MADKSFGVKELNLLNASGTPTVTSPNNLNLNANTVAISTSATVGNNLTVTSTTNSANLNVTGIGTLTRGFATDLSVSGISTISQPSNSNPHSLWDVVNNGSSAYRFTGPGQSGDENNPNIYLVRGQRYIFKVNASGHPFQLRVANGGAAYSDGVTNNGAQTGNVVINVQHDAPAQLYYQCTSHGGMVGNIYIVGGPQVISGVVTATTFVGNLTGNVTGTASANAVLTGSTNNTLVTVTGANAITGEANLTFNGGATGDAQLTVHAEQNDSGADSELILETSNDFATSVIMFKDSTAEAGSIAYNHGDNYIKLSTNGTNGGTERLRIASDGKLSIDRTHASATTGNHPALDIDTYANGTAGATFATGIDFRIAGVHKKRLVVTNVDSSAGTGDWIFYRDQGNNEALRIDSNGDLGLGIAAVPQDSGARTLHIHDTDTGSGARAAIRLTHGSSGSSASNGAFIGFDNNPDFYIYNQENGNLRFGTNGSERFRVDSGGRVQIGTTSAIQNSLLSLVSGNGVRVLVCESGGTSINDAILFRNPNGDVGRITTSGSSTSYNTSSDYRLKENLVAISDGITRLKTLKPYRFNFIKTPDTTVDGFLAHEVTAVPEATTGTKDEVDSDNNPVYQGIDQSKLVPLLTAALQEAITKIETLEAEVAALKGS